MSFLRDLLVNSTDGNTENCKKNPVVCFRQVVIDTTVIVLLFTFLTWHVEHKLPKLESLVNFTSIFIPCLFLLKAMDLEYSSQLARVAGWTIGTKIFSILTM